MKLRGLRGHRFLGTSDPKSVRFDPYLTAAGLTRNGKIEEAIWLTFLATTCGAGGGEDRWHTVRSLYSAFGDREPWSWDRVRSGPEAFRVWMRRHRDAVRELRFGNHRKYETHDPMKRGSTADVVKSYVHWVEREGGVQAKIFEDATAAGDPEQAFDAVYRRVKVERWGRTARFDWLCLLGNLGIFRIAPGRCYLRGASEPLNGARRLFAGRRRASIDWLERQAVELARALQVPIETVEDALCNWQKRPQRSSGGWVSSACGAGDDGVLG